MMLTGKTKVQGNTMLVTKLDGLHKVWLLLAEF